MAIIIWEHINTLLFVHLVLIIMTCLAILTDIETCPLCPNGVCYDFGGNISCQCPFTENRTLCDIQLCGEVCNNRSTCENINGTYECQCKTGYTGKNCEEGKLVYSLSLIFCLGTATMVSL